MTRKNVYGTLSTIPDNYAFEDWEWGDVPKGIVEKISIEAGRTVLEDIQEHAWLTIGTSDDDVVTIEARIGEDIGDLWVPFPEAVEDWITSRLSGDTIHPEDAKPLVQALEEALARIKPLIRS